MDDCASRQAHMHDFLNVISLTPLTPWSCLCFSVSLCLSHAHKHRYTEHRLRGRDRDVTLCSQNALLWSGQKQQADRWGLCLGAGERCVAAVQFVCVYWSCLHLCLHLYVNAHVCVYVCICMCVFCWRGGSLKGHLCVCPICHPTLLTPKGMAEGVGDSF